MEQLIAWLSRIVNSWKFWVVVAPWEVGVLVRLGKRARALQPGPHWRFPFLDQITLVNTRLRVLTTPAVTIRNGSDGNGLARVRRATVGYVIHDPLVALQRYNRPEAAIMGLLQAKLATDKPGTGLGSAFEELESNGLRVVFTQLVEDVDVPTLRLLQGGSDVWGSEAPMPVHGGPAQF